MIARFTRGVQSQVLRTRFFGGLLAWLRSPRDCHTVTKNRVLGGREGYLKCISQTTVLMRVDSRFIIIVAYFYFDAPRSLVSKAQ